MTRADLIPGWCLCAPGRRQASPSPARGWLQAEALAPGRGRALALRAGECGAPGELSSQHYPGAPSEPHLRTGSGLLAPCCSSGAPAGGCSLDHGSRAFAAGSAQPRGAGCRGHCHLLHPRPPVPGHCRLVLSGPHGFSSPARLAQLSSRISTCSSRLCPGQAAVPLPPARLAGACGQTHHRHSVPLARAQERCWLSCGPAQQQAGGWGCGGLPACGMAAVPPPAPLSPPGETGLPEGGSSLIQ